MGIEFEEGRLIDLNGARVDKCAFPSLFFATLNSDANGAPNVKKATQRAL